MLSSLKEKASFFLVGIPGEKTAVGMKAWWMIGFVYPTNP
jgi:hypothetical protein